MKQEAASLQANNLNTTGTTELIESILNSVQYNSRYGVVETSGFPQHPRLRIDARLPAGIFQSQTLSRVASQLQSSLREFENSIPGYG